MIRLSNPRLGTSDRQVAINWAHPLSVLMSDCVLFGLGQPVNLCTGLPVTLTSSPTWSVTASGPAGYATGGSSFDIPDHGNIVAGDFAIRVLFMPVSWPAAFTVLIDKGAVSAREMMVCMTTTNLINYIEYGGSTPSVSTFASAVFTPGQVWDFIITRSGINLSVFLNGTSRGTDTSGTSGTTAHPSPICFGRNITTGGVNADIKYIAVQIWRRALSLSEAIELYFDPYCFLSQTASGIIQMLTAPQAPFTLMGQIWA